MTTQRQAVDHPGAPCRTGLHSVAWKTGLPEREAFQRQLY